jgi:glycosyltransferase involved in cell wall biosynthesis
MMKLKLMILAPPNSIHTKRWIASLSKNYIEIILFGVHPTDNEFYCQFDSVKVISINYSSSFENTSFRKIKYLSVLKSLKKIILEFKPDIIHAHYASSYGLIGALTKFHPLIISVWGSDIYEFPKISFLHKMILKYNLSKADYILSTSHIMAGETKKYTDKAIEITPFGVDVEMFKKSPVKRKKNEFIIGTVKTLSLNYGIDILIKSFHLVIKNNPKLKLKLQIIGDGPDKLKLQQLAYSIGIRDSVEFLGQIDNNILPNYYNNFSVAVFLSISESFGVVAVEAMACECPVVVSNAEGFKEVVINNKTGLIVPIRDIEATAMAIQKFIDNDELRYEVGQNGRERVVNLYDWNKNVEHMLNIYNKVISTYY